MTGFWVLFPCASLSLFPDLRRSAASASNTDVVKTGEQIVLQNRFWNQRATAFFFSYEFTVFCVLQMKVIAKKKMQETRMKKRQKEKTNLRQGCAKCYLVISF